MTGRGTGVDEQDSSKTPAFVQRSDRLFFDHWRLAIVCMWLLYAAYILYSRTNQIHFFMLGDTDDNLRMAQVRALLGGQGWFDLTQHRFDPVHGGANIHWSRIVDLPIAAIILLLKPIVGGADAERIAAAVAPLLPLLPTMFALALTMRRLVGPKAWPLPLIALLCAFSTINMFSPLRIDHHGWQLAMLAIAVAGMADPQRARGGATMGVATGVSLAIGLEMMIYLALLGGAAVLIWVADAGQKRRLAAYAGALVASTGLGFLLFASNANRLPVCDALSPVWLADAAVGGAMILALSRFKVERWTVRLGLAVLAGAIVAAFHVIAWPNCLERLEGVSAEATALWLDNVREARPFYRHGWRQGATMLALPVIALFGWGLLLWRAWRMGEEGRDLLLRTVAVMLPALAAFGLLFWQTRAAPSAQLLALPAAAALAVLLAKPWLDSPKLWKHALAILVVLGSLGAIVPLVLQFVPPEKKGKYSVAVATANRRCPSLAALAPVQKQPKGIVFTFIDLGPRLIVATHHDTIGGPYHRNDQAIADVMKAFRGTEANARATIMAYGSDYLLVCPNMSTATIFTGETPKGFYAQLIKGRVPSWLEPIDLGRDSPLKMWRVVRTAPGQEAASPGRLRSSPSSTN
ncbi:AcrB/AcrD/AcrF family protein [Sphingomonas sp. LY160]|uniref:AcrB/AcrD/AcrF family protein n=1 Tax=Sphingomonas sp. LY160 TaxID=3095342 RepID=UPI002ADEDBCA|nr:AcrB/AcrD/AcrF family protein [Sphingomonas sp. LY160]MEA1072532.1 AcrB/AcrD/AcrF family protein [Sphingomonas sp. LY160]